MFASFQLRRNVDIPNLWVIKVVRGDISVLPRRERAVEGVLRDEHHALLLQVVHDEVAHGGLAGGRAWG